MDVKEVAALLGWSRDSVKDAIRHGVALPRSSETRKLAADDRDGLPDISDEQLQDFLDAFEAAEPGRHPPVTVHRELRTEARHRCAICRSDLPLQFHHILEWHELKHHDPRHMLAVCGGCHDKINTGQIDKKEQRRYKRKLQDELEREECSSTTAKVFPDGPSTPLSWDDLRDVVRIVHDAVISEVSTADSRFDFSLADLDEKNRLNRLGADTFAVMLEYDEPFFGRIQSFLENPRNADTTMMYHEVVDELRRRIAAVQVDFDRFEDVLNELYDVVLERFRGELKGKRRTLRKLFSFMYVNCDIGRKK
ncbi:MAG: HNH endonuclease [bacterium]|nr:HNH endonuclease [bacterium]